MHIYAYHASFLRGKGSGDGGGGLRGGGGKRGRGVKSGALAGGVASRSRQREASVSGGPGGGIGRLTVGMAERRG